MKEYFEYQGTTLITGSRDATREAFQKGLITDGDEWMDMIKSQNMTTHTYNQKVANDIVDKIKKTYFHLLKRFYKTMTDLALK